MRGFDLQRVVLGVGSTLLLVIVMGCMGFSVRHQRESINIADGVNTEKGHVTVPARQELDVYYPVPFVSPPNLTINSAFDACALVDQQADHFRVRNTFSFPREVTWQARGVRSIPLTTIPVPAPPNKD